MTKPPRARTGFIPGGAPCPVAGKKSWPTKADAKAMAKRTPRGRKLAAYRCGDHWHLGHLPKPVVEGRIPREQIYPPDARRAKRPAQRSEDAGRRGPGG